MERFEHWRELFSLEEDDIEVLLGPRVDDSGDWTMDVYARYNGEKDMEVTWDAQIDYSSWSPSYEEMMEDYKLWKNRFEEELEDADLYFAKLGGVE